MPREVVPIRRSPRRASRQHVELTVIRKDQVRAVADEQPAVDVDADPRELVDFREQRLRIDDDAVADDARHAVVQDARRDEMQHELLAFDVYRVTGVVATLVARHDREVRRQQIDDLALALVAPLRAQHCKILCHVRSGYRTPSATVRQRIRPRRLASRSRLNSETMIGSRHAHHRRRVIVARRHRAVADGNEPVALATTHVSDRSARVRSSTQGGQR